MMKLYPGLHLQINSPGEGSIETRILYRVQKMRIVLTGYVILLITAVSGLSAQEIEPSTERRAQVTFAYPLGSRGAEALGYSNDYSFNILYGLNGGVHKFEIGSLVNFNKGDVRAFQLSGISNITTGFSGGFIISGVSNISLQSTCGFLLAGALNLSKQNSHGLQIAPANIVIGHFEGIKVGVFNYSGVLNGVQFGVFNYVKSNEDGLPLGLFSYVENGYFKLEATGGESIYSAINFKMGVEEFYTIFKTGFAMYKSKPVYAFGLGFGSHFRLSERQRVSVDLSLNRITYDHKWDSDKLNMLSKADVMYEHQVTKHFALMMGPSLNCYISEELANGNFGTLNIPYSIYSNESSDSKLFVWIGLNAGISLTL